MSQSDQAIRIRSLGKQYRLGIESAGVMYRYKSLRDSLGGLVRSPLKLARSMAKEPLNDTNSFWALKNVNFEVNKGEVIGIIGRNGAGKSTLLKILSRITKPTAGEIELHGRVGSLLEVGTGFHPELSGRENIFLNGAVLGMTGVEVKRKFDEIVAFSEIETFLDTPVKQYSSGMYTRLAFAVAAHLEPEILVVDEVLAVGDAEFQKKCLGKMKDVAKHGRTVLFVSHNLSAVRSLCNRSVLLSHGQVVSCGNTPEVTDLYMAGHENRSSSRLPARISNQAEVVALSITPIRAARTDSATVSISIRARTALVVSHLAILVYSESGVRLGVIDLRSSSGVYRVAADGVLNVTADIVGLMLVEGDYSLGIYTQAGDFTGEVLDIATYTSSPRVQISGVPEYEAAARGLLRFMLTSEVTATIQSTGEQS